MMLLLLPAVLAFLMVLFGMPSLIMLAKRKHLVDEPSESRKLHHRSVPTVGGVMIFAAVLCSALMAMTMAELQGAESLKWIGVMGVSIPIFFMGLKDDIMGMSAGKKLLVHLSMGLFLVVGLGCRIENFHGLFGVTHLHPLVSNAFSLFVYIVIVNAINLIDGVDGLAGGFGMVAMGAFAWWFDATGNATATIMATTATAMEPRKSPPAPGSRTSGINANTVVRVEDMSGIRIRDTAPRIASVGGNPASRRLRISSVITMEPSTSRPSATTSPVTDMCWIGIFR